MIEKDSKVKSLEELAALLEQAKAKGLRIAQCHGVFDLLHPGHIRHLDAASRLADILVVTLTPDEFVNKGPGRPAFNQKLRAEALAALGRVDYVALTEGPSAVDAIRRLRPDLYVKGSEYARPEDDITGKITDEEQAVRSVGGRIHFTDEITFSSTKLLNRYFSMFDAETDAYLRSFRKRFKANEIIQKLQSLGTLRALVIGDVIIDEYHYCRSIGKASKSATLSVRFISKERQAGGALAVANHLAGYAQEVHLLACLGEPLSDEGFLRDHLKPNVKAQFIRNPGRTTVVKRRYVDPFQMSKMLEVQWLDGDDPGAQPEDETLKRLESIVPHCDLAIVADFGHGAIGPRAIRWLAAQPIFLAVNAQTNSANIGYNLISKYPRADYICIDEEEMRLANHDRSSDICKLTGRTAKQMGCSMATVTRGSKGSLTWSAEQGCVLTPVFATEVVDSVGAGDAYLSVTSLCAKAGFGPGLTGFVGNSVGALAVRCVGNREPVEPIPLFKFITTLIKS